jgi:hypothetical protein
VKGKFSQGENYRSIILCSAGKILRCAKVKQVNKKLSDIKKTSEIFLFRHQIIPFNKELSTLN